MSGELEEYAQLIAMVPCGGWRVAWRNPDGSERSEPLMGWGLDREGSIWPLSTDQSGLVLRLDPERILGEWRVYHPEECGWER